MKWPTPTTPTTHDYAGAGNTSSTPKAGPAEDANNKYHPTTPQYGNSDTKPTPQSAPKTKATANQNIPDAIRRLAQLQATNSEPDASHPRETGDPTVRHGAGFFSDVMVGEDPGRPLFSLSQAASRRLTTRQPCRSPQTRCRAEHHSNSPRRPRPGRQAACGRHETGRETRNLGRCGRERREVRGSCPDRVERS